MEPLPNTTILGATDPLPSGNTPLSALHAEFLDYKRYVRNVTPKTLVWHREALRQYQRALNGSGELLPTTRTMQTFVTVLRKRGVSPVSVNTWLRALRAFCTWLQREQHLTTPLTIESLKTERKVLVVLGDDAIEQLLRARTQPRMHTLMALLLETGLRIDEALSLQWDNVDIDKRIVKVLGKGRKEREIPFGYQFARLYWKYQHKRRILPLCGATPWVFSTRLGTAWSQRNALRLLHSMQRRLHLPMFGWHRFRHTCAMLLRRSGTPLDEIQHILGHSRITTTQIYQHLGTEDLRGAVERASVLSRLKLE